MANQDDTHAISGDATAVSCGQRQCKQCGEVKPLTEFYGKGKYRDGRERIDSKCKQCKKFLPKHKCYKCGKPAYKSNVQCKACSLGKTKEQLESEKQERLRKASDIKEQKKRLQQQKTRSLPIFGVILKCTECGTTVIRSKHKERTFCSKSCSWRDKRRTRRARNRAAFVSEVSLLEIAIRDKWTCKICGKKVKKGSDYKRQATLDHVIPISKGGKHEPSNCQLAHFDCNSRKHDAVTTLF